MQVIRYLTEHSACPPRLPLPRAAPLACATASLTAYDRCFSQTTRQ